MKRLSILFSFTALALAQPSDSRLPLDTRVWVATKIYAGIQTYFAHAEGAPQFDLDRDYQQYLKTAFANDDRRDFDIATMAFVGKLRNGHSGFYDTWLNRNYYGRSLGFALEPMAEGWVVMASQVEGLNPGDVVTAVAGKPIEQFFAENDGMIEGSSELTRRRHLAWLGFLWPEKFDLELAGGKHIAIDQKNQKVGNFRSFPQPDPVIPEDIGYIRIRSFQDPSQQEAAIRRVKELMSAKAIVFDVRGNGGGSTPSQLISLLLDRPWRDFRFTTPLQIAHAGAQVQARRAFPNLKFDAQTTGYLDAYQEFDNIQLLTPAPLHAANPAAYKDKVFLLIDGFCNSACEDFVEPFKASGRATLIGQTTNGSSGQPYYFDFGNGMSFRVSSKRYYMPDGSPFEGVGIQPDVEVRPTLADWTSGADPVLAKALTLAAEPVKPN